MSGGIVQAGRIYEFIKTGEKDWKVTFMVLEIQNESMNQAHITKIASELSLKSHQVKATAELLDGGATIPFIARYRKEITGSLDEIAIINIRDRLNQLRELYTRRESIIKSLDERDQLTDELKDKIMKAETIAVLEDIYLPYRPKRRTRATIAREKGLEPLAEIIYAQEKHSGLKSIMLTSLSKEDEARNAKQAGIHAWITKPVRMSFLFNTIITVMNDNVSHDKTELPPAQEEEMIQHTESLLVAEDNPVNQMNRTMKAIRIILNSPILA